MVPQLLVRPARIVAEVDKLEPCFHRCVRRRTLYRRIAAIGKFELTALAAPGAGDQQHVLISPTELSLMGCQIGPSPLPLSQGRGDSCVASPSGRGRRARARRVREEGVTYFLNAH